MTIDMTNVINAKTGLTEVRDSDWFRMTSDQLSRANVQLPCAADVMNAIASAVREVVYYIHYEHETAQLEHAHDTLVELIDALIAVNDASAKMLDTMIHVRDQLSYTIDARTCLDPIKED